MIEIVVWILICYGATNIVVYGKIFEPIRNIFLENSNGSAGINKFCNFIYEMITCSMCFSVWFGFFLGIFFYSPTHEILFFTESISWFFDGILSSGGVWIINSIIEFFEENRFNKNENDL